jgi:hypothetical protein
MLKIWVPEWGMGGERWGPKGEKVGKGGAKRSKVE